jgi:Dihydrodipicolinate synthase/N-acetylneuraminate lyase
VKGVFPAFPTIFDKEGKLLLDDMDNLLEFAKNSGVDGIFLHLVGGEYYKLELEERKRSIIAAVNLAPLGLPIYVNASSQSFNTSLEIIKLCEQIGVNGIILNSPYFSPLKGENAAFSAVTLNLISKTDLPVILQFYDPEPPSSNTILRNFLSHENVVAVKLRRCQLFGTSKGNYKNWKTRRYVRGNVFI